MTPPSDWGRPESVLYSRPFGRSLLMVTGRRGFGDLLRFAMFCACLFLAPDRVLCKASEGHHDLEDPLASCCLNGECDGSGAATAVAHGRDATGSLCACPAAHRCTDVEVTPRTLRVPSASAPDSIPAPALFRAPAQLPPARGLLPPDPPSHPFPDISIRTCTLRI